VGLVWTLTRQEKPAAELVLVLPGPAEVTSLAFSPDGRTLAAGDVDGTVTLREAATGTARRTLMAHPDTIWSLAYSPDGRVLATGSRDATLRLWDPVNGREVGCLGHGGWVQCVTFAPDSRTLATGSADGVIRLWNVAAREA